MVFLKKTIRYILAVFLISISFYFLLIFFMYLKPAHHCSGQFASKISDEIRSLSKKIGFSSFQIAYYNTVSGQTENCTYGWKAWFYPRAVSVQDTQHYASLSKILTSMVVLKLVEDGKLSLDDSIDSYLHEINRPLDGRWHEITILDLLTHHSGITLLNKNDPMLVEEPLCPNKLDFLDKMSLRADYRQNFEYSNLGYCLLGVVIERVEGEKLESVFERMLFKASHTDLDIFLSDFKENKSATGVYYQANDFELSFKEKLNPAALVAVGSWEGSANSMMQVLLTHLSFKKHMADYSDCKIYFFRGCHVVGFFVYQKGPSTEKMIWRDGSLPGVTAFIGVFESGEIVVLLANARREQYWKQDNEEIAQKNL